MAEEFAHGFTPGRELAANDRLPFLSDAHHPLLGRHVPLNVVPDYPDMLVVPGYAFNRTHPTHFRAYTRTRDGVVHADGAETWEEAKYRLRLTAEAL